MSESLDWQDHAACRGAPVDWFFPDQVNTATDYAPARRLCRACPVIRQCLDYILDTEMPGRQYRHGMWAGLSPQQRYDLSRALSAASSAGKHQR